MLSIGGVSYAAAPGAGPVGGIGLRLVDVPAGSDHDPRARLYIVDHLAPGSEIERRVEITNTTSMTQAVDLYAASATIADGTFVGGVRTDANEVSTWTAVTPGRSDIAAGEAGMATVTIEVPPDASPGERYGVVWAETRSAPIAAGGVVQVSRVGIRIYLSVGTGGAPEADFEIESLTAGRSAGGQPTISASVHNSGGRALDLQGELNFDEGPGGLRAGPFPAQLGATLAIGDRQPVTIVLDEALPAGPWDARITLASGLVERTVVATVTFPASGSTTTVQTAPSEEGPWWPAVGVLALGLAIGAIVGRRRRRARMAVITLGRGHPLSIS